MPYADLFVGILVIIILVIIAVRVLSPQKDERELQRDAQGKLIANGGRLNSEPGQLKGRGTQTSAALELRAGSYALKYAFAALTRLALLDATGDETLIIAADEGETSFEIAEAGRFRLLIEPSDENAEWAILYWQVTRGTR